MSDFLSQHTSLSLPLVMLAAFAAGFVNAVAGGGTFISFPALTGIAKLSEKVANMTSTIGLIPGSMTAVFAARRDLKLIPRSLLWSFGIISLIGGTIGSLLLIKTDNKTFTLVIPWLLLFATAIFAFSKPIARWAGRKHGERSLKWTLFVGAIQLLVAIYGGYFGAGIGVLMLAGLAFAGLDSIHHMNALKVTLGTIINGIATLIFAFGPYLFGLQERVDWTFAPAMAIASAFGGFSGMHFARKINPNSLRYIILGVGAALTAVYFYRAYGG